SLPQPVPDRRRGLNHVIFPDRPPSCARHSPQPRRSPAMTTQTNTDTTPRAWIGCLACYNNARLVGESFDAETADEVTLADVHGGAHRVRSGCEELWVMDHENIPALGEMSPSEAVEWARVLHAVPEHQ